MGEVGEYLFLALVLSLLIGVVSALSLPEHASETRAALGAVALFALASPIVSLLGSGISPPSLGEIILPEYSDGYTQVLSEAYEDGLCCAIAERLGIERDEVSVLVRDIDVKNMRASSLRVTLTGGAALADVRGLREWLSGEFLASGADGEVVIEFG